MRVFLEYDDLPRNESLLEVKSVSVVPESLIRTQEGDALELLKVIALQNGRSVIRHNVLNVEVS